MFVCCCFYLKDAFVKAVSTINREYTNQKQSILDMQTKLEENQSEINTLKTQLEEKEKETITLKVKLEENSTKDDEIKTLRRQLQDMEDTCKKYCMCVGTH